MGYCGNKHGISYQPCGNYVCGDSCATANYSTKADLPGYTARFYSQTQHEVFSDFRYDKVEGDYKSDAKEIVKSVRGPPIEAYIPRSVMVDDGGSAIPKEKALVGIPKEIINKKAIEEIEKARREVTQQEVVFREIQIEELLLRRVRTREVRVKKRN